MANKLNSSSVVLECYCEKKGEFKVFTSNFNLFSFKDVRVKGSKYYVEKAIQAGAIDAKAEEKEAKEQAK